MVQRNITIAIIIIVLFVVLMTKLLRSRDRLEF